MNDLDDKKEGKERTNIFPLSKMANSIGSSIFEGNDRDLVWDREISAADAKNKGFEPEQGGRVMPKELQFISLKEGSK